MAGFFLQLKRCIAHVGRRFVGKLREVDIAGVVAHHTVVGHRGELYLAAHEVELQYRVRSRCRGV